MPVRGVDHQQVDTDLGQGTGLRSDVAVDADRRRDPQPATGVDGGGVDPALIVPVRVSTPARVPSASVITATSTGACSSRSNTLRGSVPTGAVTKSFIATSRTRAKRSTPMQLASVTRPIGLSSKTTTAAPCARL